MVLVKNSILGRLLFYLLIKVDLKMQKVISFSLVIFNVRPFKERDIEFCGCSNIVVTRVTSVLLYAQKPYKPAPKYG